jgi:DNA-binding transcriptional regulator YhcF (GntR family)
MPAQTTATRLYVVIPLDVLNQLVPKLSEAYGLYNQLANAVTCDVPNSGKSFGLVLGGKSMSQREWAKRFRMSERSFQRALSALKEQGLVVVHRGQHDSKIALTDSVKRGTRRGVLQSFPWLLGHPDPPNMAEQSANMAELTAYMAELDDPKNLQVVENTTACTDGDLRDKKVEKKVEEREKPAPKYSLFSSESTPTPTATANDIADVCAKLYAIGKTQNPCQATFTGKHRTEIGRLLSTYSAQELCAGYTEFVKDRDDFEMRHAPRLFVEGGAVDVILSTRERERVAAEKRRVREGWASKWRQREIDRHRTNVEVEVLEEQEQWGREEPSSSELYQRYHLKRAIMGSHVFEHPEERAALAKLRAEAAKTSQVQDCVNERLASEPPFNPGTCPSDYVLQMEFGDGNSSLLLPEFIGNRKQSSSKQVPTFDALKAFRESK